YLVFPWFLVVMVLGISPVSGSRLAALGAGILSRPVTRFEYLLAAWAARVVMVLFIFLVVIVPFMLLIAYADRPVTGEEVTLYGMFGALLLVGLVLTFLVSLGFLMGTLLRRPMVAAVILIFAWIPINLVLSTFSLEEFSPWSLNQALPTLLRTPWSEEEETVEETVSKEDADAVARQAAQVISILSGKSAPPPASKPDFFNRTEYEDFSLTRVILGYTLPTLAAIGLAMLCFCWRDL
nr:ABC transporter permease subunit [Planctomycetota bacterium]